MRGRVGRRPKRAVGVGRVSVTLLVDGVVKNLLVEQAEGFGLSLSEYVSLLVRRESGGS